MASRSASRMGAPDEALTHSSANHSLSHRSASPTDRQSPKRMSKEQLANLSLRMSRPKELAPDLGPLHSPTKIPQHQLDQSIDRMYKQALDRKTKSIANARQKRDESEAPKMVKISHDDLEESVRRLYNQSVERQHKSHEALADKYLFKLPPLAVSMEQVRLASSKGGRRSPSRSNSPTRPASPMESTSSPTRSELVSRLYTEEINGIAKRAEARYQKYIVATEPKMVKADDGEISAIVDRLYTGGKK